MAEADDRADFAGFGDLVGYLEPTKDGWNQNVPHDVPEAYGCLHK